MDTSEQYVKMCDCPEIQEKWEKTIEGYKQITEIPQPKVGDIFHLISGFYGYCDWGIELAAGEPYIFTGCFELAKDVVAIWLPRQDQLQGMVADRLLGLQTVCAEMYEFAISEGETNGITIDGTMEQLWLAFVMQEKYNKIWDNENWVKR